MNALTNERVQPTANAIDLVTSALGGQSPSVARMLEYLAKAFDAFGCVLWECRYEEEYPQALANRQLVVAASHFQNGDIFALHDLPVSKSLTGLALLEGKTQSSADIQDDPRVQHIDPVIRRLWLGPMVTTPIAFADGTLGAVNLYRKHGETAFERREEEQLASVVPAVPALYQAIRDRVSLDLIRDINDLLNASNDELAKEVTAADDMDQRLVQVANRVAATFHSLEVSIFLEDSLRAAGVYPCVATTWKKTLEKKSYTKNPTDGMTGWALYHQKPVLIFDWETYPKDRDLYERMTPGAIWSDPLKIVETVRKELQLGPEDTLPPVSFLAVPIVVGPHVVGIIRSTAGGRGEPYYYNRRDLELLHLVAAEISRHWGAWLNGRKIVAEKDKIVAEKEMWEARTFEDLQHQVRGPLNQVQRRVEWLMEEFPRENRSKLAAVRGLCRKAVRAAGSIGILAKLADDKPLTLSLNPLNYAGLVTLLIELADDNQVLVAPAQGLEFDVDRASYRLLPLSQVRVDKLLLEQALNNVLDNAGKYSYANTVVRLFGGQTKRGNFHITVANTGIPIPAEDVRKCLERGERLEAAKDVSDEGSGIGLWIADKIMKAHGGHLEIVPTTKEGETQVRLIFPTNYTRY